MDEIHYQAELLSFAEKEALSQLEVSRAQIRVDEIKFERSRFMKDMFMAQQKAPGSSQAPQ